MGDRSDDALVRAARVGDDQAFREIVDRHGPGMYRYALRLCGGSDADAGEATQDALVSAWKDLATFRGDSSLRTWLFRLVHRRAVDLQRRRRPTPVDDDLLTRIIEPSDDDPLQDAMDHELLGALQKALDELSSHQRSVWLLREVEGMSYAEIAQAMGIPEGSVRGHLHRGRKSLAERMERWR